MTNLKPSIKDAVNPPAVTAIPTNSAVIGRHEYLQWVNASLRLNYKCIEEMCTGAAYCQFIHILFPHALPFKNVIWDATERSHFSENFKILQRAFVKIKADKDIPVFKLTEGKYMENFAFLQWFKGFYDANFTEWPENYNAEEEREKHQAIRNLVSPTINRYRTPSPVNSQVKSSLKAPEPGEPMTPAEQIRSLRDRLRLLTIDFRKEEEKRVSAENDICMYSDERNALKDKLNSIGDYCVEHAAEDSTHLNYISAIVFSDQITEGDTENTQ